MGTEPAQRVTVGEFEVLFAAEFERCVRIARRIVGREDVARDLAAEAFARAWTRWSDLRDRTSGAWVVRVTTNLAIDAVRRRVVPFVAPAPSPSPEDASIMRLALVDAMRTLPPRQCSAIALRYLADCSEDEIAAVLGVSKGTVKVHLHRGLKSLRAHFDAERRYFLGSGAT